MNTSDTIVAISTPPGHGALGIVRLSGNDAISLINNIFPSKDLLKVPSHSIHLGSIMAGKETLDEVLVSVFKTPNSYTKENVIEISCHGSQYILQRIVTLTVSLGARLASPGEFTQRAFLNGRFDLLQAEAVADLIASENAAMQQTAISQMRGGFSSEIKDLREQLVHFASMIELELDFAEEDVEFADRQGLIDLISKIQPLIRSLIASFEYGNAIKNGIPTVIAGKPNAGKSTLLNALLNEEKAIVSEIPGTTRDFIEDQIIIEGISYRFIDTAGIRETEDQVESIGVERTYEKMQQASLVIYLFDLVSETENSIEDQLNELSNYDASVIIVGNKEDAANHAVRDRLAAMDAVFISARERHNLDELKKRLISFVDRSASQSHTVVTNVRHQESLQKTDDALVRVTEGIKTGISGDLIAQDIRQALFHLGEITGEVTTDDLLENIFSKFCIGK